jgi:hypothetical protein
MEFDPLLDYGKFDLTNKINLVYWRFSELIKTLIILSSNSERQVEIIGFGEVCCEMAEDFDTFYKFSIDLYLEFQWLTSLQIEKLNDLSDFFDNMNQKDSVSFWNDDLLAVNLDWMIVRKKAKDILETLGMQNLEIEFDRKESINQKTIVQSTKIRLVNKVDK